MLANGLIASTAVAMLSMVLLQAATPAGQPATPAPPPVVAGLDARTFQVGTQSLNSLIYLPEGYATSTKRWPLMIFLHGAGQRGVDPGKLKKNGPILWVTKGRKFPFVIVAPQCPAEGYWSKPQQVRQLKEVLDTMLRDYRIDESCLYLTGLSMGAHGVWSFAASYPEQFAAIAPIAGGAGLGDKNVIETARLLSRMPIWVFHGDADDKVPFKQSQETVDALKKGGAGDNLKFTIYPGVKHDSWSATYANDELYSWLMSKRKPSNSHAPTQ